MKNEIKKKKKKLTPKNPQNQQNICKITQKKNTIFKRILNKRKEGSIKHTKKLLSEHEERSRDIERERNPIKPKS